ncbi:MAG: DNA adenine methylase [Armatimonadetes bacterium]|nr:DNA adenine methylase [Armatimonadota bacterium]
MRLNHPYLTDQLIPYIGNKRKLLPLVHEAVRKTGLSGGTFFDVFSGSGVVARLAKLLGFRVIANDWEPYSEIINKAYIAANAAPEFRALGGLENAIALLNNLSGVRGYIASHYCPADDERYDVDTERMFYTQQNGRRIDAMRERISEWRESGRIDATEEATLLAPLIYQASYCSNTSGVFKGFHRGWGGATKTAWYRIRSHLTLDSPILHDNGLDNIVIREDAALIADKIDSDIAYLDPPYNQHQYGANYHLLNTVALWDKPPISEQISGNGHKDKAAIRKDWRTERRSEYCYKSTALDALAGVVSRLRARYILVSYSTEGLMPVEDMLSILGERGALDVVVRKYKRYRVSSQRPSPKPHTTEFVAIVDTSAPGRPSEVEHAVISIMKSSDIAALGQQGTLFSCART